MVLRHCTLFFAILTLLAVAMPSAGQAAELVGFSDKRFRPGTIVIKNSEKRLYLVLRGNRAIRYKVAVGRPAKAWTGTAQITAKYVKPSWSPSPEVRRDFPNLPAVIRGGAPNNPMGVAAMTLSNGNYAIHGTNRPGSIGRAVSYGCIRMSNRDVQDLFQRVGVRTAVVALP
ncbi:L,D-transpeptidase-like protein [Roseibium hamelinense]|uniref:L,D-transpeptidase-like protein n=1 Tax=Roseibium hamelinense TaxID=150831 RepID=A0A562TA19_9HYPH|nr:L,D-transpeptidase [Roseibium hamelinense]MTI45142.1 L,D-transpeptidase [Roseibium hamelinense]TWI90499.1 L,D-transpeptidase-like protein [Roseibium hamelinense]